MFFFTLSVRKVAKSCPERIKVLDHNENLAQYKTLAVNYPIRDYNICIEKHEG